MFRSSDAAGARKTCKASVRTERLAERLGLGDRPVCAVHMSVLGDAPGQMLVVFDRAQAMGFVETFIKRIVGNINLYDSIIESTLREIGNIIGGAYLTAITTLTSSNLLPSVPTLSVGTVEGTIKSLVDVPSEREVFFIETGFQEGGPSVAGQFILIPHTGSLGPLFAAFGLE